MSVKTLDKLPAKLANHASYSDNPETSDPGARPPSWALLQEQVDASFAFLFADLDEAERALGAKVHPAPLGCVSKQKTDGTWKHRLIQALMISGYFFT